MQSLKVSQCLSLVLGAVLLTGCASKPAEPTVADRMRGHAADVQQSADLKDSLAQQWERGGALLATGNRNVEEGERRLRAAERDVERAREQIKRGRGEVSEGQKLVRDAEQRFSREFPGLELN